MAVLTVIVALAACGGSVKPTPAPEALPPAPVAVAPTPVTEPVIERWTMPAAVPVARYQSDISAALERDSAGRTIAEKVETHAVISLSGRRDTLGAFRGTGTVDSFVVRGLEGALAPNRGESPSSVPVPVLQPKPLTVQFEAAFDSRNLRVSTRPALANECDRPETGATALVRDLLVRLPKTVSVGQTWTDSSVSFVCRLGVPITSRSKSVYTLERADKVQGGIELAIRRVSDVVLAGELRSTWRTVLVNATGKTTHNIRVDGTSGIVRSIESDGLLTIKLSDSSRRDGSANQEIRQATKGRVVLRP
ncbi:MAG: hypothetical protein ACO1Q7_11215 [Gemmatimonas sp.]